MRYNFNSRVPLRKYLNILNTDGTITREKKTLIYGVYFVKSRYRPVFKRQAFNVFGLLSSIGGFRNIIYSLALFIGGLYSRTKLYEIIL